VEVTLRLRVCGVKLGAAELPEGYEATVPPHGVVAFRIHPAKR